MLLPGMLLLLVGLVSPPWPALAQIPTGCSQCETPGDTMVLGTGCGNTTVAGGTVFAANSTQPLYFRGQRTDNWAFFARTTATTTGTSLNIALDDVYASGDDPASPTYSIGNTVLNRDGNYLACYYIMAGSQAVGDTRESYLALSNPTVGGQACTARQTSRAATIQSLQACCLIPNQNAGDTLTLTFVQTGTASACPNTAFRCTLFLQLLAGSGGD